MRVSLDFTTPFQVGDQVFTHYPPAGTVSFSGRATPDPVQATIASIKLVLALPGTELLFTEPSPERVLTVHQLVYTLLPEPSLGLSAFTVSCPTDQPPQLFTTRAELLGSPPAGRS